MTNLTKLDSASESPTLVERYRRAMAKYKSTIEGAKRLHGKDFYEAQLRVVEAHLGFEQARLDVLNQRHVMQ
jgi:hypothetical protein